MSENVYTTDTRFFCAQELRRRVEEITGRRIIHTVKDAEPLGPASPMDALIIAPTTGNTLAKLASGITDTAVTMAAKAHLRCDRPTLLAIATNDAMSQNLQNIARVISRRSVYLVPMRQDDPIGKPHSLVADFSRLSECFTAMMRREQIRPLFV
jgi:dipicolinate synthase subunit B